MYILMIQPPHLLRCDSCTRSLFRLLRKDYLIGGLIRGLVWDYAEVVKKSVLALILFSGAALITCKYLR